MPAPPTCLQKNGLVHIPESPLDCIFAPSLATPTSRWRSDARAPARAWSRCICPIDEAVKSVSLAGAGDHSGPASCAGRGRGVMNDVVVLTRFLDANRRPLRSKTLWIKMSASEPTSNAPDAPAGNRIANQPYLLLSITAMCWAGNAVVGRLAAGHIAPVTLSFLRWSLAFIIVLPFAWKHLARDWGAIRGRLGLMIVLSITGIGAFNTLQYWALEHTQALNTLPLESGGPP